MGRGVPALVEPDILVWARESAGFDVAAVAKKLRIPPSRLRDWEDGDTDAKPTVGQLRRLANIYKRPLSVFYLPERPATFRVLRDYRRLPGADARGYSPELMIEQRITSQRREQAVDFVQGLGMEPQAFRHQATMYEAPEVVGGRIREILKVSPDGFATGDPRQVFNLWRERIERAGVLVFQMSRVPRDEVSGFAISHEIFPVIAVNRRRTPHTRRTFSLLHEFAHLMLRQSGVSDIGAVDRLPETSHPEDIQHTQQTEVWCNAVAAATLMPRDQFLSIPDVRSFTEDTGHDMDIETIARRYGVSREAIVRRLNTLGKVSRGFYDGKRTQYLEEWRREAETQNASHKRGDVKRSPAQDVISEFGRPFVRLVLGSFHENLITLNDVSSHFEVRVKHLPKIGEMAGFASSAS